MIFSFNDNKYTSYVSLVLKDAIKVNFEKCNKIFLMHLKILINANFEIVLKQRNSFLQLPFLSNK